MKCLSRDACQEVARWIYQNARPLELLTWQYLFEDGDRKRVVDVLMTYQNTDGGFGHALEPDNWNPESSPYTTHYAISLLKRINLTDLEHPVYQGIKRYLSSGVHFNDRGWLFSIPSTDRHPHAPWWTYDEKANKTESIGLSAGLISFVLRFFPENSHLYDQVLPIAKSLMRQLLENHSFGEMGLAGLAELYQTLMEQKIRIDQMDQVCGVLRQRISQSIVHDTRQWTSHVVRPSRYIKDPSSPYYAEHEAIMNRELDYLAENRNDQGVWNIDWSWYDLNQRYAPQFAISENWWKAVTAIETILLLREFNRLDYGLLNEGQPS